MTEEVPAIDTVHKIERLERDIARLRNIKIKLEIGGEHPESRTKLRWHRSKTEVFSQEEEIELMDFCNGKMRKKEQEVEQLKKMLLKAMPVERVHK
jgi:hypothetical protein